MLDGILATRREAIERDSLRLTVLVELVYVAEIGIIGTLEMGRDEQEGISLVVEYLLGDVVTGSIVGNRKVVDGRHIAFFHEFTLALYECPCGVGIVVEGKLATLPVFLHHKGILVAGHLGALGYLHTLADVGSHMIGAEIEARQQV